MSKRKSDLQKYCEKVITGKIVASKKIIKLCNRLLGDIEKPYKKWHFDIKRAEHATNFIERFCYMPSGRLGRPFILEDYEKAIVQAIFGFVDDSGNRRYQEALVIIGRKNGKTSLSAAIELYMLIADGEGAPQIYNIATKGEQAELGYNACVKMLKQSKQIQRYAKKRTDDIYCSENFGFIKPMTSNTGSLDGLDVHLGIIDELAAIKNRDLYDLIKQGMAAREQPLLLCITTNGFVRNGIFDAQYEYARGWLEEEFTDDRFLAFVYELDEREEWTNEKCWIKANPGLGTVKKLDTLRNNVNKAKNDPTFKATVLTKDFNIPENSATAWLSFEEAVNEETFDIDEMGFRYGICGFDLSSTIDLTCAQMLCMKPNDDKIYEVSMYWIPEDALEDDTQDGIRRERDDVPYKAWIARGLLRTVPGNKIDKQVLLDWLEELKEEHDIYCFAIGYDPWGINKDDTFKSQLEAFVGKARLKEVRQGTQTLSQPMKALKADLAKNRIVDNHNPINEWCRMNVQVKTDENDNIKPVKKLNNPSNRIDGFAAEIDAYTVLCNMEEEYLLNV